MQRLRLLATPRLAQDTLGWITLTIRLPLMDQIWEMSREKPEKAHITRPTDG